MKLTMPMRRHNLDVYERLLELEEATFEESED
jgi:hypothetical protein